MGAQVGVLVELTCFRVGCGYMADCSGHDDTTIRTDVKNKVLRIF